MPEDMGALRDQLTAACADVADRRNEATNQDEIASLNKALAVLQTQLNLATLDALDNAANAVAEATKAMRDVTASAQTDPIQQFVDLMQEHIAKLDEISPGAAVPTPPPVAATDSPNKAAAAPRLRQSQPRDSLRTTPSPSPRPSCSTGRAVA